MSFSFSKIIYFNVMDIPSEICLLTISPFSILTIVMGLGRKLKN